MKYQILCAAAVIGLACGCAEVRKDVGATAENDQNVLTGGPVTGTRLDDLPQAVRNTLRQQMPSAEVADIDREVRSNGQVVYQIQFSQPGKNPTIYISENGQVQTEPARMENK